jgi:hypothetical protein
MTGLVWDMPGLVGPRLTVSLTAADRSACWADLAGNAREAYASIWRLVADKESVAFLREHLKPAPAPAVEKEIQKLVADLGSDKLAVR